MSEALNLAILLTLKDELSDKLSNVEGGLGKTKAALLGIGAAAATGLGMAVKTLGDAVSAAAEEEQGVLRLKASVEASGAAWDEAEAAIEGYLETELKRTALDDGEGREAISRLTQITGDYREALQLTSLAQDLAAAKGMSLTAASELVGRVAEGNTAMLKRYGIVLQEGATAQEALAAMQAKFAGQAEAYGNSTAGAQARLNTALGNLKETVGGALLPVITAFTNKLAELAMQVLPYVSGAFDYIKKHTTVFIPVAAALAVVIGVTMVAAFWAMAGAAITAAAATMAAMAPVVLPILAIIAAIGLLAAAWENDWGGIRTFLTGVWENSLKPIFETIKEWFTVTLPEGLRLLWEAVRTRWDAVREKVLAVWDALRGAFEALKTWLTETLPNGVRALWEAVRDRWQAIQDKIRAAWDDIRGRLEAFRDFFTVTLPAAAETLRGAIAGKVAEIQTALTTAWSSISSTATTWWNTIVANIRNCFDIDWGALGSGIITAIRNGVQAGWAAFVGWLTGLVRGGLRSILEALHIPIPEWLSSGYGAAGTYLARGMGLFGAEEVTEIRTGPGPERGVPIRSAEAPERWVTPIAAMTPNWLLTEMRKWARGIRADQDEIERIKRERGIHIYVNSHDYALARTVAEELRLQQRVLQGA